MEYKKAAANVTAVSHDRIEVTLRTKESFASCKEKGCHLCSAPTKVQKMSLPIATGTDFEVGDFVILTIPSINEALAAFSAFILPLIVTLTLYFIVTLFLKWPAESGRTILTLIVSFFLSFFIPVFIDRYMKNKYPIEISRHGEC